MKKNRKYYWFITFLPYGHFQGGAVEEGENLQEAVIRETREEPGVIVEVKDLLAVNEAFFQERDHHAIMFTFQAGITDGTPSVQDSSEISEVKWVDIETADELMPYIPGAVKRLLASSAPYTFQGKC